MIGTAPAPKLTPRTPARGDAVVRIDALSKSFPVRHTWIETLKHPFVNERVTVIDNVSCEVQRGEFFGLLGPNGAGKTTLFKMLATLILPDEGSATVCGYDVVKDARAVRALLTPVIAEERSLNWRLSARENLYVFAALYGLRGSAERRARADEVLEAVELADTGEKMVGKFSSGMKQRLLIARALLARPKVLLLDEPTRSLDPLSARRFREFLREEIVGRRGCTALLATHSTEEALELCDRVAVLDRGRLLAVGTADSLGAEIADGSYRLWTRTPEHRVLISLEREGRMRLKGQQPAGEGWHVVEMQVPGGLEDAAAVLARLHGEGVEVARFERIGSSLADLIGHIVERGRNGESV